MASFAQTISYTHTPAHMNMLCSSCMQVEVRGVVLPAHAQLCVLSYEHDWCLHDINVTERADRTAFDPPPSFALVRKTSTDFVRCLRSFTSAHFMLWFACVCRRGRGVCCGPDRVHPKPQRTRARARMSRQAGACMRACVQPIGSRQCPSSWRCNQSSVAVQLIFGLCFFTSVQVPPPIATTQEWRMSHISAAEAGWRECSRAC
jgi:hypothetical protein